MLCEEGNLISIIWVPFSSNFYFDKKAKKAAQRATEWGQTPQKQSYQAKSTIISTAIKQQEKKPLSAEVGKYSKKMNTALSDKHTCILYNILKQREANTLAQLWTEMTRLNEYLHRIEATESDQCLCDQATETVKHFLFQCMKWETHQTEMLTHTEIRRGSLSFYLEEKAPSDPEKWMSNNWGSASKHSLHQNTLNMSSSSSQNAR